MPRKPKTANLEIVPLSQVETLDEMQRKLKIDIAGMIESAVSVAMHGRGRELQPFFGSKEVAYEIKRRQTVNEQKKFTYYFADYGCMLCGSRERGHGGAGMCVTCYSTVKTRLRACVRKREKKGEPVPTFSESMRLAREAFAGPGLRAPPPRARGRPRRNLTSTPAGAHHST